MKRATGGNGYGNLRFAQPPEWKPAQVEAQRLEAVNVGPERVNQKDLAKILSVSDRTLTNWHNIPGWNDSVISFAVQERGRDVPNILLTLSNRAVAGDVPAAKLFLQAVGVIAPDGTRVENHFHGSNGHKPAGERTQELRRLRGLDPLLFE